MSYEMIALLMFSTMMLMLLTGQRVFGAIGFVGAFAALFLWGDGGTVMPFSATIKLMKWYPVLTLPMFIFMGYIMSESRIADDLYEMFHVWMGPVKGGLAIGTIFLMVVISAMNGLSVAGMAIGATIALPELLRRNPGGKFPWDLGSTERSSGSLWHDCKTTCWAIMVSRSLTRIINGKFIHIVHLD